MGGRPRVVRFKVGLDGLPDAALFVTACDGHSCVLCRWSNHEPQCQALRVVECIRILLQGRIRYEDLVSWGWLEKSGQQ